MIDPAFMRLALSLAQRGYGATSPNPMVGAVLVKGGKIIGRGWHRRAGLPHAEIEAIRDAEKRGHSVCGATLYVTLEPCSTHGRTPPCTDAILAAGIRQVVIGTTDPNPKHRGKAFKVLQQEGARTTAPAEPKRAKLSRTCVKVSHCPGLAAECAQLNETFNHWIVHRTPFVTVKAAMTLDGRIATASGESKWITSEAARRFAMNLRQGADAILVGVNTILADDPGLTWRSEEVRRGNRPPLRRIVLDSMARTPLPAKVVSDAAAPTTVVVSKRAPKQRVVALAKRVSVLVAPLEKSPVGNRLSLRWLLRKLGSENVMHLLVEGGGEVNASFLFGGLAHRIAFFYAPKILGGRAARKAVAGAGAGRLKDALQLRDLAWRKLGPDLLLTARVKYD